MKKEIEMLREVMRSKGIYAAVIPSSDFHCSEYIGEYFKLREYLSGFTGSAGTLVVTLDKAALWTDGRYFLQAERELSDSGISLMKMGDSETPTIEDFLKNEMPENSVLGFDGRTVSDMYAFILERDLRKKASLLTDIDFGELVWKDRPPLSAEPVFMLPEKYCGRTRAEKIALIREKLKEKEADCLVVSALDEIAWTLNLRGGDIEYCPLFLAFMMIFTDNSPTKLFANKTIFSDEIVEKLKADNIEILDYNDIYSEIAAYNKSIWFDVKTANHTLESSKKSQSIGKHAPSPIELIKAIKDDVEISCEKNAHIRDGLAVTRFMKWLKSSVGFEKVTEISAAEKLEELRKLGENYLGQSFAPIMAYGEHGAIVHYSVTEETNAEIKPRGMLLSDTGGHYLDGTTDITRTFVLGEISEEEKRAFTLVLAGHLNLLAAKFPKDMRGSTLDYAAREPLWQNGYDYRHSTGHGVGFVLNVHEGPQRISCRAAEEVPPQEGMITSDEPGLYVEGKFGIRHESLLLCEADNETGFLKFSPLTLVPFDREGIEKKYLDPHQIETLNDYHALVFEKLSPLMDEEEKEWLRKATEPI